MQINRLFEIIYVLLDKGTVTAKELAERFEVSARTVYRDVEILSAAGIPIYMSKGKGGGISLLPDFILNKTVLTEKEKEDVLSSLKAMNAVGFRETDTALQKLGSLLGGANTDWIEVDFSSWSNAPEEERKFNTIKDAILSRKVVAFTYASAREQQPREAEPVKLCFKGGAWYLYAYCKLRYDFRFFKLRRIKGLRVTEEGFQRSAPARIFSEETVFPKELVTLKLKFSPKAAYRVYDDEFETCEPEEDGSILVEMTCPKGEWLFGYIASFGSDCEVLAPENVRDEVKAELEHAWKQYFDGD